MALQYPDTIQITLALAPTKDADGNPVLHEVPGARSVCRAERQVGGPTAPDEGGNHLTYAWKVFMPPLGIIVPFGSRCELTLHSGERHAGQVKEAVNGQFNTLLCL